MAPAHRREGFDVRRARILRSALDCFLQFGFHKASIDDIARRAGLARTLVYRIFRNKEDVFAAAFEQWLASRHPAARAAAAAKTPAGERLSAVMELLVVGPWREAAGAAMAREYYAQCRRLIPEHMDNHRRVLRRCTASVLGDELAAEVLLLSLDGLLANEPSAQALRQQATLLIDRFAPPPTPRFGLPGAAGERPAGARGPQPAGPTRPYRPGLAQSLYRP